MRIQVPVGTAIFWMVVGVVAYAVVWPMLSGAFARSSAPSQGS